jgi:FixJ family two-component response regulator
MVSVVDDDESVRDALVGLMQSHGYSARAFESAEAFWGFAGRPDTDCVVADIHMPGVSGLELCRRLGAEPRPTPTILITARHDERARDGAMRAGAVCYLPKPFDEDELIRCIGAALAGGRRTGEEHDA